MSAAGGVIIIGLKDAQRAIKRVSKQVPFATKNAINATAKDVQKHAVNRILPSAFTLRSRGKPWQTPRTRYGMNIKPFASKRNLVARVGSLANWLALHETGGLKKRDKSLALPTALLKKAKDILPRRNRPARLLERMGRQRRMRVAGKSFIPITRNGEPIIEMPGGQKGIWVRDKSGRIRALFRFQPKAKIRKTLHFRRKAKAQVNKVWRKHFSRAMDQALKTAKN